MKSITVRISTNSLLLLALGLVIVCGRSAYAQSLSDALAAPPTDTAAAHSPTPIKFSQVGDGTTSRHDSRRHRDLESSNLATGVRDREMRHEHNVRLLASTNRDDLAQSAGAATTPAQAEHHRKSRHASKTQSPTPAVSAAAAANPSIDSMTRDGGAATEPVAAGQGINIGGAIIRWVLSLVIVLALAAGAIAYLRRKGYGLPVDADQAAGQKRPAAIPKPIFGMSPIAQLLMQRPIPSKPAHQANSRFVATAESYAASPIENLTVLASGNLPGSNYTLYKMRVEDRILLLAGAPGTPLNLLTEWDVETPPQDERRFDVMLEQLTGSVPIGVLGTGLLQSAAERLEQTTLRVASLGRRDRYDSDTL